ncbi:RNA-guided endonuclease InsQ/TnpB family protein [Pseudonocardia asaccharolytica]|uniref:Transposase n=1 Tax=Pseudonocardia asaccharolytica DSM 44247 = NBRC 16224 TaxID=1123024 RepID=A0A511D4P5_9PSEU|nr:RNA-guided endonuclease TnpB family protein [Pseudonocardia asaccharolytica]GEL18564.1 hypothetical protein PA7_24010 [Pseudonocardia asaccharolytica DSM 44247 = NBRC 16224]
MPIVRYRYRVYPTPDQEQALARTFGCARVVYNDCLRIRQEAYTAGEKLPDSEVQRRVITLATHTPERAWLGEVASVALVQACQDARRAYRNWLDSLSGKRKGRRIGRPRFRSRKDHRQSIRLTRNGFTLRANGRVHVAKVGELRVEWSRPLPSVPSSCAVIREADGRYYVSFVVERDPAPLPPTDREVGVALGLGRLAVTSDGQVIANPRHLRAAQRRLARSIHDAGWSTLVRLIEEKATHHGRTVVKIDRWYPSSRLCSTCGHRDGPKPLAVRSWTCPACGSEHDRDLNAARNVLAEGRRIAAGLAEIENACGGDVRPGPGRAAAGEAGTRLGALA